MIEEEDMSVIIIDNITLYVVMNERDEYVGNPYDTFADAKCAAERMEGETAVVELTYVFDDSDLAWTSTGENTWPPAAPEDPEDDCDECGQPAPAGDPDNNRYHATSCSLHPDNIVTTVSTYDHNARPDDDNEPGDRCKDCGEAVVWIGDIDWLHVNDMRNQ